MGDTLEIFFFSVTSVLLLYSILSSALDVGPILICILKNASLWSVTSIPKDVLGKDDVLDKDSIKHCNDGCPRIQRSFFFFSVTSVLLLYRISSSALDMGHS